MQGVTPISNGINMKYVPGSRLYLLESEDKYKMFKLKNREISFDYDFSKV